MLTSSLPPPQGGGAGGIARPDGGDVGRGKHESHDDVCVASACAWVRALGASVCVCVIAANVFKIQKDPKRQVK